MTIDKAIETIEYIRDWNILPTIGYKKGEEFVVSKKSLEVAIDTMRKYQKIEQIIKTAGIFAFDVPEIKRIAKVLKDGNNN